MSIVCLVCDHQHPSHRYACDNCINTLQRKLRAIGDYWDLLDCQALHEPTRGSTGRSSPGYTSRPPARLDVLVALDPRSNGDIHGPDDIDQPIIGISAGITHIARWVRARVPGRPCRGLYDLLVLVPYVAMGRDVGVFAGWVTRLHQQCRSLVHDQPPRAVASCMAVDCEGRVYAEQRPDRPGRAAGARCSRCRRTYTGLDLVRLSVAQEAS